MNERLSNIELLRIIAMLMVLFLHSNFLSLGNIDNITSLESLGRVVAEQLCIICVNVFVLISGWFGLKPNIKGAFSLLFQVFFYAIILLIPFVLIGSTLNADYLLRLLYFGSYYWFVPAYLVLYAFSPVLNAFISQSSSKLLFTCIVCFFILEFVYGWFWGAVDLVAYHGGCSTMSFIGRYLLGRFMNLHFNAIKKLSVIKNILLYFLLTLIPVLYLLFTGDNRNMFAYSSPFVVLASMFFFLTFTKFKFHNKYINYLASSSFSIYLIHLHPSIWPYYENIMNFVYENYNGLVYTLFVIVFAVLFSICCMLIDKIRLLFWCIFCRNFIDKWICYIETIFGKLCNKIEV